MPEKSSECRESACSEQDAPDDASRRNFILQQGFGDPDPELCPRRYAALVFQPRVVAGALLVGLVLQSPVLFLALGVVLWWSALFPRLNPFDALYNRTFGSAPGHVKLDPAPGPRRFAQTLAGCFCVAIAVALFTSHWIAAYVLETLFAAAVAALSFGRFCLGSFLYHLLGGRKDFALRTLPWSRER